MRPASHYRVAITGRWAMRGQPWTCCGGWQPQWSRHDRARTTTRRTGSSAAVLCRCLVELEASAVIDLYELRLSERRRFERPPQTLERETLAQRAGKSSRSSAFSDHLSKLRETGLIDEPQAGQLAAALLFPTLKLRG